MSQQPDKLFKTKLENYQRPAPAGAWSRIESGLSKKNNSGFFWLKIAASLLLVVVASFGIVSLLKKDNSNPLMTEQTPVEQQPVPNEKKDSLSDPTQNKVELHKEDVLHDQQALKRDEVAKTPPVDTYPLAPQEVTAQPTETINEDESNANIELVPADETTIAQGNSVKSFKLVIEADEVNEKYLTKRTVAKATSEDDSSSGIKKLLDKANDLKNNQDPFGDLRQMKNEILALNFPTNKKHEQNK